MASPTGDRVAALSKQLAETHQELRRRLAALRSQSSAATQPHPDPRSQATTADRPHPGLRDRSAPTDRAHTDVRDRTTTADRVHADLRTHCLAFCSALTTHHQGEDSGLFAALLHERPDLAPTIDKLVEDHGLITGILTRIADLSTAAPAAIALELDGLAAIMESHFRYEERALAEALDAGVPDNGWSTPVLRLKSPPSTR